MTPNERKQSGTRFDVKLGINGDKKPAYLSQAFDHLFKDDPEILEYLKANKIRDFDDLRRYHKHELVRLSLKNSVTLELGSPRTKKLIQITHDNYGWVMDDFIGEDGDDINFPQSQIYKEKMRPQKKLVMEKAAETKPAEYDEEKRTKSNERYNASWGIDGDNLPAYLKLDHSDQPNAQFKPGFTIYENLKKVGISCLNDFRKYTIIDITKLTVPSQPMEKLFNADQVKKIKEFVEKNHGFFYDQQKDGIEIKKILKKGIAQYEGILNPVVKDSEENKSVSLIKESTQIIPEVQETSEIEKEIISPSIELDNIEEITPDLILPDKDLLLEEKQEEIASLSVLIELEEKKEADKTVGVTILEPQEETSQELIVSQENIGVINDTESEPPVSNTPKINEDKIIKPSKAKNVGLDRADFDEAWKVIDDMAVKHKLNLFNLAKVLQVSSTAFSPSTRHKDDKLHIPSLEVMIKACIYDGINLEKLPGIYKVGKNGEKLKAYLTKQEIKAEAKTEEQPISPSEENISNMQDIKTIPAIDETRINLEIKEMIGEKGHLFKMPLIELTTMEEFDENSELYKLNPYFDLVGETVLPPLSYIEEKVTQAGGVFTEENSKNLSNDLKKLGFLANTYEIAQKSVAEKDEQLRIQKENEIKARIKQKQEDFSLKFGI